MGTPVIVGAARTAIARSFKGTLVNTPPETLITTVLPEVVEAAVQTFQREEARLIAIRRGVGLVEEALRGRRYVARL